MNAASSQQRPPPLAPAMEAWVTVQTAGERRHALLATTRHPHEQGIAYTGGTAPADRPEQPRHRRPRSTTDRAPRQRALRDCSRRGTGSPWPRRHVRPPRPSSAPGTSVARGAPSPRPLTERSAWLGAAFSRCGAHATSPPCHSLPCRCIPLVYGRIPQYHGNDGSTASARKTTAR